MFGFKPKKTVTTGAAAGTATAVAGNTARPINEPKPLPLEADAPLVETTVAGAEAKAEEKSGPDSMLDIMASEPPKAEEGGSKEGSLADLFAGSTQQEEKTSLSAILDRTPDASIEELMEDLNEIREMLRGRLEEQ